MKADTCHRRRSGHRDLQRHPTSRRRLTLEALETRRLLATIVVTTHLDTIDSDPQTTSLREAITQANERLGDDTITFTSQVVSQGVIELTNSQRQAEGSHFWVRESLTITVPGPNKLEIDAARQARHFTVQPEDAVNDRFVHFRIVGLKLTQGSASGGGGSIAVENAKLTVEESEITNNTAADDGGGIILQAELRRLGDRDVPEVTIDQSTIALNKARGRFAHGGGISVVGFPDQNDPSKTVVPVLNIENSTISQNSAEEEGGAIFLDDADADLLHVTITGNVTNSDSGPFDPPRRNANLTLVNTIVAGNIIRDPAARPYDIPDTITVDKNASMNNLIGNAATSGGLRDGENDNIVGVNDSGTRPIATILDTLLRDNGGPTRTHALVSESVAINAADEESTFDQRIVRRPKGPKSDIGSFEADSVSIEATANGSEAGPTKGEFTVTRTEAKPVDLVISYTVTGTATEDDDYVPLSGSVTIPRDSLSAKIDVETKDDAEIEEPETVIVTLTEITSGGAGVAIDDSNDEATVALADNDSAKVSIDGTQNGDENGPVNGEFTVTLTAASTTPTKIEYSVTGDASSDVDFKELSGEVIIPAGETSEPIVVEVLDDTELEGTEMVTLQLTSIMSGADITIDAANDMASIDILDDEVPPNKRPSFAAANPPAVTANDEAQTVNNFATFDPGDPSESSQSVLGYIVSDVSNPGLFGVSPAIDNDGNLTYTLATDKAGTSEFTVVVQDDGGTSDGGIDTSFPQTFELTVDPGYCSGGDHWCDGPWRANVKLLEESNLPPLEITLRNPANAAESIDVLGNVLEIYHETSSSDAPITQVFLTNGFNRPTSQGGPLLSSLRGLQFYSSANNLIDEPRATKIELLGETTEGYLQVQTELLAEDAAAGDSFTVTNDFQLHRPTSLNTITDVTVQIANTSGRDVMPVPGGAGDLHRALSEQWVPITFNSMFVSQDWESVSTLPNWYNELDPAGLYVNEDKISNGDPLDDGRSVNGNIDVSTHDVAFIETEVGTTTLDHESLPPIVVPNYEFFQDLVVYREQSDFVQLRHAHDAARNQRVDLTGMSGLIDSADGFKWSVIYDRDDENLVDGDNIQVRLTMDETLGTWPQDAVQSLSFRITSGATANRAPNITSPPTAAVLEDQTFAIKVEANDPDNDPIQYSITDGADADRFAIDSVTGDLTFKVPPDFENPTDSDMDNKYLVQVTVTDPGELTDVQNIEITVEATSDAPLDVTGSGDPKALRDGILIIRFMFGQPPANLEGPQLIPDNATRKTGEEISQYLTDAGLALDVNGDQRIDALRDGILIVRYLFGQPDANLQGPQLITDDSTRRTGAVIREYLDQLMPATAEGESFPEGELIMPTRLNSADVNGDGSVTMRDALYVINRLNASDSAEDVAWSQYDANQDGNVSASDVLKVITWLADDEAAASSEASAGVDELDAWEGVNHRLRDEALTTGLF